MVLVELLILEQCPVHPISFCMRNMSVICGLMCPRSMTVKIELVLEGEELCGLDHAGKSFLAV